MEMENAGLLDVIPPTHPPLRRGTANQTDCCLPESAMKQRQSSQKSAMRCTCRPARHCSSSCSEMARHKSEDRCASMFESDELSHARRMGSRRLCRSRCCRSLPLVAHLESIRPKLACSPHGSSFESSRQDEHSFRGDQDALLAFGSRSFLFVGPAKGRHGEHLHLPSRRHLHQWSCALPLALGRSPRALAVDSHRAHMGGHQQPHG